MNTLGTVARLGRVVWRTYGARGLGRRGLHEIRRAADSFRGRPVHALTSSTAFGGAGAYRPIGSFALLPGEVQARIVARGGRVRAGWYQAFGHAWRPLPPSADGWVTARDGHYRFPDGAWWTVPHLPRGADIKEVWEAARFGWVYDLVRAYHLTSDAGYADAFYTHVTAWVKACPPFTGVQWSCGQEVAIRALAILHGESTLPSRDVGSAAVVADVLAWSGERIADAVEYGLSQRNNHGISEAAGLVHLGLRLAGLHPDAARWLARGRRLLDEQIGDQFAQDGWYAQHSFVYMRLALAQALAAQRALHGAGLSLAPTTLDRLRAAAGLLAIVVDGRMGAVPNHGANDGSQVLPLSSAPYHDFRPILTLAAVVLGDGLPADVPADPEVLAWIGAGGSPAHAAARADGVRRGGASGWVAVRHRGAAAFLRAGELRHRPSHLDLLHLALAFDGREVIADPGTFAYNAPAPWNNGLASAAVHNAPVLDDQEPAARGPRFLWKDWPSARLLEAGTRGAGPRIVAEVPGRVRREIEFRDEDVIVRDVVLDSSVRAVQVTWLPHPSVAGAEVVEAPGATSVGAEDASTDGWYSPTYGVRVPGRAVRLRRERKAGEPLELVTRLRRPLLDGCQPAHDP